MKAPFVYALITDRVHFVCYLVSEPQADETGNATPEFFADLRSARRRVTLTQAAMKKCLRDRRSTGAPKV